jgi:hypothetical protein
MAGASMSRQASRERAERVVLGRAVLRKSWREIMRTEGFQSIGAVQQTYKREMARRLLGEHFSGDRAELTAQEILLRRDTTTAAAVAQLVECRRSGDVSGLAAMIREIRQNDVETAKMLGLYEPARVDVNVSADPSTALIGKLAEVETLLLERAQQRQLLPAVPNTIDAEVIEA